MSHRHLPAPNHAESPVKRLYTHRCPSPNPISSILHQQLGHWFTSPFNKGTFSAAMTPRSSSTQVSRWEQREAGWRLVCVSALPWSRVPSFSCGRRGIHDRPELQVTRPTNVSTKGQALKVGNHEKRTSSGRDRARKPVVSKYRLLLSENRIFWKLL